jgi:hypothetical protein
VEVRTVEPTALDQEAKPLVSDINTLPAPGEPPSISIVPVNTVFPPTLSAPAIPTPPLTIKAPELEEVEVVVEEIVAAPVVVNVDKVVTPVTPNVPAKLDAPDAAKVVNAPVLAVVDPTGVF